MESSDSLREIQIPIRVDDYELPVKMIHCSTLNDPAGVFTPEYVREIAACYPHYVAWSFLRDKPAVTFLQFISRAGRYVVKIGGHDQWAGDKALFAALNKLDQIDGLSSAFAQFENVRSTKRSSGRGCGMSLNIEQSGLHPKTTKVYLNGIDVTSGIRSVELLFDENEVTKAVIAFRIDRLDVNAQALANLKAHLETQEVRDGSGLQGPAGEAGGGAAEA